MGKNEKWLELRDRYLNKEITEQEYYELCDEEGLELIGWIDEEWARERGFTGDGAELESFVSKDE